MKPLEIKYKSDFQQGGYSSSPKLPDNFTGGNVQIKRIDVEATLQALCDAVNGLSERADTVYVGEKTVHIHAQAGVGGTNGYDPRSKDGVPERFKDEDVIVSRHGFSPEEWSLVGFKTKAKAQAALELLLNL